MSWFQSLSRDSVCLDKYPDDCSDNAPEFQSLSRDSVCLDPTHDVNSVQNPSFQSLSRDSVCLDPAARKPKWTPAPGVSIPESGFCLFGLNLIWQGFDACAVVSIPESGFCLFGLWDGTAWVCLALVSIPESGFCLFGQLTQSNKCSVAFGFNP